MAHLQSILIFHLGIMAFGIATSMMIVELLKVIMMVQWTIALV